MRTISGRVTGARPNQRIVLYAQTQSLWWVQPYADQPFTKIQPDSTWKSSTHPGQEFAALLVGPQFRLTPTTATLPTEGVAATAVTKGLPPIWQRWWFLTLCGFLGVIAVISYHLLRLKEMKDTLSVRFEERLAERTRVAQLLHDTLLQGVISASLQLHVAVSELPADSPGAPMFQRVLQSMRQVVEEGRNTLRGLQFPTEIRDLEVSFSRIPEEFGIERDVHVHVNAIAPPIRAATRPDGRSLPHRQARFGGIASPIRRERGPRGAAVFRQRVTAQFPPRWQLDRSPRAAGGWTP